MRLLVAAMALLSFAGPVAASADDGSKDDEATAFRVAASMAAGDWIPVDRETERDAEIAEGLAARAVADPQFTVGRALKSEPVREGEPSEEDLNEIALSYFSAILDPREGAEMSGLDYLDFASISWDELISRKYSRISFAEVRERLRGCKLFEGWPRRYDRDGERVFGFDSGWRCLGPSGPYTTTLFLELRDGKVVGGRFIKNSDNGRRASSVPAGPQDK